MRIVLVAVLTVLMVSSPAFARARTSALKDVCKSTVSVSNGQFIYKNSAPLRSGGVGTPLIGYRKEPTLIMTTKAWARGVTTVYDSNGKSIGRCPWASAENTRGGRWRCTMSTSSLRRAAVRNTKKPAVYFKLNSKTCAQVPDAGRCYGSSKGLCGQLIS